MDEIVDNTFAMKENGWELSKAWRQEDKTVWVTCRMDDASDIGTDVFDIGINDDVDLFNVDADIDTDVSCTDIDTGISATNVDTSYKDIINIDTNIYH